jgi:hypothetical protein
MIRILFLCLISLVLLCCAHRPYQPNYNKDVSHNDVIKNRQAMIQKQADGEIKRLNKQRKKERKRRSAKHLNKKADKYSKKLVK